LENWNYLTVSGMVSGMMSSIVARVVGANPEEAFIFGFLAGMGMAVFHFTISILCIVAAFSCFETEIRIFDKDGKLINFDMFKGWSPRDMGNTIYY